MNRGEALANIQRSVNLGLGPIGCIPCLAESLLVFGGWTAIIGGRLRLPLGTRPFSVALRDLHKVAAGVREDGGCHRTHYDRRLSEIDPQL